MRQKECRFVGETNKPVSINFLLYLPKDYGQKVEPWPLILFLHGGGECGNDLEVVKRNGIPKIVEEMEDFPFIAISPQCSEGTRWGNHLETLIMLLDNIIEKYNVDKKRVYLTGISMGGYGTWRLAANYPEKFDAIVPICGGGDPQWAQFLKDTPIWVFHGAKDDIIPISESEIMVNALRELGNNVKFTVYPEAGHDSWIKAYEEPELYKWFLDQKL